MASSVKLISVRHIPEAPSKNAFIWLYETNNKWTPFPDAISSTIEKAFRHDVEEIFIDGMYRIDLKYFVQEHVDDRNCKQSIRRQHRFKSSVSSNELSEDESRRCERFSFPLGLVSACNACVDTSHYGSPFIEEWFLTFTKGKRSVTFDSIFPVLVQGIREEGQTEPGCVVGSIVDRFNKIGDKIHEKSEKKRMGELENLCAKLYTESCFIYRVTNKALRDNDHTKQRTLGPYCFLVFNYIGRHFEDDFSIRHRLRQAFHPTESQSMTVYRGDYISDEMIKKCQQAVGDKSKYFKWLSFVSTSRDQAVAEEVFAQNVLYEIKIQHYLFKDQLVDMSTISSYKEEKEIVLQPGVRFQVDKVEYNDTKSLHLVHVNIVPSYVSGLR